jgi:uncharacterized YigZ family protein
MMGDTYKTISEKAVGIFKDKGSKFLAFAYPVCTQNEIKEIITNLKKQYHDARHHCFAYRLGAKKEIYRLNDDGEPSGTAGKPIYGQILSVDLTDILIVVVRYFGGILLGTGGLINAYRTASADALNNARIIVKIVEDLYTINFDYTDMSKVMRIIREENLEQLHHVFDQQCEISLKIRQRDSKRISNRLESIQSLKITKQENNN